MVRLYRIKYELVAEIPFEEAIRVTELCDTIDDPILVFPREIFTDPDSKETHEYFKKNVSPETYKLIRRFAMRRWEFTVME